jgi:hypothetical protein
MSFDTAKSRTLFFGGSIINTSALPKFSAIFSDTWIYENDDWKVLTYEVHPSARRGAAMAYIDGADAHILVAGEGSTLQASKDVWIFSK